MSQPLAPKTRKLIAQLLSDLPYGSRDATSLMNTLLMSHALVLEEERENLIYLGVSSLIQSVSKRRGRTNKVDDKQQDFWSNNNLRNAVSIFDVRGKRIRKRPNEMTFSEMETYVKDRSSVKRQIAKPVEAMAVLLEELRPWRTSSDELVADCWARMRKDEAA
jgi:hypothetical protein